MARLSFLVAMLGFALALTGCELAVDFDRSKIDGSSDTPDADARVDSGDGGRDADAGIDADADAGEDADAEIDADAMLDGDAGVDGDAMTDADATPDADLCSDVDCSAMNGACTTGVCDPTTGACTAMNVTDGATCDDGLFCTTGTTCNAGACGGGTPVDCSSLNTSCRTGTCSEETDACVPLSINEGMTCDDGLYCTTGEVCTVGVCVGGTPRDCSAMGGACRSGVCDEAGDTCSGTPINEGMTCDDGLFCTVGTTCTAGTCGGATARDCSAMTDDCRIGVCSETADACMSDARNEGMTCDDAQFCTVGTTCTSGVCMGGTARDCSSLSGACTLGICNEAMDMCRPQNINEGGACTDALFCTVNTTCAAGTCSGGTARDCSAMTSACATGACNETVDTCEAMNVANGTTCDDGMFCTTGTTCTTGVCGGGTPLACTRTGCTPTSCDETTDMCAPIALTSSLLQVGVATGTGMADQVRLRNPDATHAVSFDGLYVCANATMASCVLLGSGSVAAGGTALVSLPAGTLMAAMGEIALFEPAMGTVCDYVEWGVAGQSLEANAVAHTQWTAATFATAPAMGQSIVWDPTMSPNNDTAAAWSVDPTF